MDAAPAQDLDGRGAPRLFRHFAALELLTQEEGPSGRARLALELGGDMADLLVDALARNSRPGELPAPLGC